MSHFLKSRIPLIGICFLALGGCTESGPDARLWAGAKSAANSVGDLISGEPGPPPVEAPDPGDAPYPNLGAFPRAPTRTPAATVRGEEERLLAQREGAKAFDEKLRALDPVLDPKARPPEPPVLAPVAAAATPVPAPAAAQPPQAATPIPVAPAPTPVPAPAPAPAVASVPPTPAPPTEPPAPIVAPAAPVVAPAPVPAAAPPQARPAATVRPTPRAAWTVGNIVFAENSPMLSAEARAVLRAAVAAANERSGAVRLSPLGGAAAPADQALSPRRLAAAAGELEALELDRSRIAIDAGVARAIRVTVEY